MAAKVDDPKAIWNDAIDLTAQRSALALGLAATQSQRDLAANVASVRFSQRRTAEQTAYRTEMRFVLARNDLRRAMWWSFASYTTCLLCCIAVIGAYSRPALIVWWRGITIVIGTIAVILALVGIKRDGVHARNSWTRLRWRSPIRNI